MMQLRSVTFAPRNDEDLGFAREILEEGIYDIPECPRSQVFVDIGCCAGLWSAERLLHVPDSKVIALDIMHDNCECTRSTLKINSIDPNRYCVLHAGVGFGDKLICTRSYAGSVMGVCTTQGFGDYHLFQVPCLTLRDILREARCRWNAQSIHCVKIDCEGGEYGFFDSCSPDDLNKVIWFVGEYHNGVPEAHDHDFLPKMKKCGFSVQSGYWPNKALFRATRI